MNHIISTFGKIFQKKRSSDEENDTAPLLSDLSITGQYATNDLLLDVTDRLLNGTISDYEMELFQALIRPKYVSARYEIFFTPDGSQIRLTESGTNTGYAWSFIEDKLLNYFPPYRSVPTNRICGLSDVKDISSVVTFFSSLFKLFPGSVDHLAIDRDFPVIPSNAEHILSLVTQIGTCKMLCIEGINPSKEISSETRNANSKFCSQLLNTLTVIDEIHTWFYPADESLDFSKVGKTSHIEIFLLDTSPEEILSHSSIYSIISVPRFGISKINRLLPLWLQSNTKNISYLCLHIEKAESENVQNLFNGLVQVGGIQKLCCDNFPNCHNEPCAAQMRGNLHMIGVTLNRHDHAQATIFYSPFHGTHNFVMVINPKPGMLQMRCALSEEQADSKRVLYDQETERWERNWNRKDKLKSTTDEEKRLQIQAKRDIDWLNTRYLSICSSAAVSTTQKYRKMDKRAWGESYVRQKFGYWKLA